LGVLKYSSKEDKHFLILELSKKEQVNEGIVNALRSSGFMTSVPFEYNEKKRAFRYDLEGLIPITADNNMCVTCHMPEVAKDVGATPIPKSHLYSIRNKKDLEGKLSDDRFNCTTCHVPQANVEAKFKNNFKPEYRDANSSQHSNLLDVLNEGVR